MNRSIFDIDAWAADTLAMIDEAAQKAREDALRMMEENNRKWDERRALREKLTAEYGDLIGLVLYQAGLEKSLTHA